MFRRNEILCTAKTHEQMSVVCSTQQSRFFARSVQRNFAKHFYNKSNSLEWLNHHYPPSFILILLIFSLVDAKSRENHVCFAHTILRNFAKKVSIAFSNSASKTTIPPNFCGVITTDSGNTANHGLRAAQFRSHNYTEFRKTVSDKKFGMYEEVDMNMIEFSFPPEWSDLFHVITPVAGFDPLVDLVNQ